ncbi:MAG: hypothetical protein KA354_03630 [Phycisphaerae bacterium]|nr:hypothetical protein [Phycisphaerae bacterium]
MFSRITVGISLAAMFALLSPVGSAVAANLLANPGFEAPDAAAGDQTGVTGWNEFGEPWTRWVTRGVPANSGLQSLKMFGPWSQWAGTGMTQAFPAAEGQLWEAGVYSRNDSIDAMQGANFCVMKVEFYDASGAPAGGGWATGVNLFEVRVADALSPLNTWQYFTTGPITAPAGTAVAQYVLVEVQGNDPVTGGSVFLDDASFGIVPEPASFSLLALASLAFLRRPRG